jgi:proline iminopeptidase
MNGLDRIRHLPASIVQARYDMVCPIVNADELARLACEIRSCPVAALGLEPRSVRPSSLKSNA